jgi:hypothetical protein
MREVCLEEEPRFTTASLLAAETELIARAKRRQGVGVAVVPDEVVARVIAEYNRVNPGRELDGDQEAMIWRLCASGNGVNVVVGKAGIGKSTALAVARQAFQAAGIPVIGVAPTANAARQRRPPTRTIRRHRLLYAGQAARRSRTRRPPPALTALSSYLMKLV